MSRRLEQEIDDLAQCLRVHGPSTFQNFVAALILWLFGVLVFIPLANSVNWQTGLLCSLVIFTAFTVFMYRAVLDFKKIIDAFSFLPARKYGFKWGINQRDASTLFKYFFYIVFALIVYALYFPFLISFHFAISGIVLIVLLIWIFFLALRILSILSSKILEQFKSD
jgi:predicted membrane chloride channel (bestrophin family)